MEIIKNKQIILFLVATFIFVSCNEDEFLEQVNPNAITTATFWKTEGQFNSALTTVYGALQFQNVSGGELIYEMILGDIGGTESWYRPTAFRNLTYNDGTYYVTNKWDELYIGIFRANQVIQYIQDADPGLFSGNSKMEIEAQARFLRAFFYFQLAHTYGGAVIQTTVAETSDELKGPFKPKEEVINNIVIPDLEYAKENLPQRWSGDDLGRITWGAATSLLGKVYLFEKNWSIAATQFKEVIDSNIYRLVPNVMDNYSHENELNQESIFEVAYEAETGQNGAAVDATPNEPSAEATTIATAFGFLDRGGYNTLLPSYNLHEMFIYDEVDPTNSVNDGNRYSKRMISTIAHRDDGTVWYGEPIEDYNIGRFGQSAYVKKHTNWYHLNAEDGNSKSGINFRHIRYADVLLMYAEAILNANGDYQTAITYIDRVRNRAGVKTLQKYMDENGGKFPQLHVSVQVHGDHPMVDATTETVLTHLQRVERPLELCFEGHRWKDLVRWGIVAQVLNENAADEQWRFDNEVELNVKKNDAIGNTGTGVAPLFIRERIRPDYRIAASNYNPSQHDYFPIPIQEQQTNDQLNN
ncbi:RagB/SusD family nutrient uptake outer membrane protein [Namhaeicola litoreus]|uniref:RagB/SusD family nutrient uptake outer membrane protein n=1 Tax=Namhaeicola litoreus TaxID=1052145 RepID=A0ABW3Y179_9FLAO